MLKNNKVNMVIAFVLAVFLWAFVLAGTKNISTETIRNVPISFVNEDMLSSKGLVVLSKELETINIEFSGERSVVSKVRTGDFRVVVDLQDAVLGSNTLAITIVDIPENIKIESKSDKYVTVNVDEYKEEEKPVKAFVNAHLDNDQELIIRELEKTTVKVMGPATLVDSVKQVNATADISKAVGDELNLEATMVPVDKDGKEVERVTVEVTETNIKAAIKEVKTVPLTVVVSGEESDEYKRTVTIPETVKIAGKGSDLLSVDAIMCEAVDLSEVVENRIIQLKPQLPPGIELVGGQAKLVAVVKVESAGNETYDGETGSNQDDKDQENGNADDDDNRYDINIEGL